MLSSQIIEFKKNTTETANEAEAETGTRALPHLFFAGILVLLSSLFAMRAWATNESTVSPALTEDSAEVPPTSKSERGFLASSATVVLASDYIYRGLSQTFGRPTAQGSLDFTHNSGFGLGFFASNINLGTDSSLPGQSEADAYLDWNRDFETLKVGAMILSSNYVGLAATDSLEYSVFVGWKILKFDFAFMPKYFGVDSTSTYFRLTASVPLQPKDTVILAVGRSHFSDQEKVGFTSYSDFKAGINHTVDGWGTELDWTGTDRKYLTGGAYADRAIVASLSRTFE